MVNEGTPSYKYVDDKIKSISDKIGLVDARLDKLIKVHESDFTAQKAIILETQRILANLQIRVIHNESINLPKDKNTFPQFVSEMTTAFNKVKTSESPLSVAENFRVKRWNDLDKLGIEFIKI